MASELQHQHDLVLAGADNNCSTLTEKTSTQVKMEEATLLVAIVAVHQFIAAVFTLFNEVSTEHENRMEKK